MEITQYGAKMVRFETEITIYNGCDKEKKTKQNNNWCDS